MAEMERKSDLAPFFNELFMSGEGESPRGAEAKVALGG